MKKWEETFTKYCTIRNKFLTYLRCINFHLGNIFLHEKFYLYQIGEYFEKYIFTLWKNWTRL